MKTFVLIFMLLASALANGSTEAKGASEQIVRFANSRNVGEINPHLYSPNEMFAQNMVYDALVAYDEKTGKFCRRSLLLGA